MLDDDLDAAMDAFAAGDAAAFATVDALARPRLCRSLRRLTREPAAADDLAQDTLIRVVRARHRWRPGSRFLPWAHAIARRLFLDRVRRSRLQARAYDALGHREASRCGDPGPEVALQGRRLIGRLDAVLARLPAAQRTLVLRLAVDGDPVAAVAGELGADAVAVRVRLFRARRAIAAALTA